MDIYVSNGKYYRKVKRSRLDKNLYKWEKVIKIFNIYIGSRKYSWGTEEGFSKVR